MGSMEVRVTGCGRDPLTTKVCFCDEPGFQVASVIVMGERDAVLIDAQWTLSNAHRVISEVIETGRRLTTIYITHAHPDHYFGVGTIAEAFPDARVLALPRDADMINRQFFGKAEIWEDVIGPHNVCRKTVEVEPLAEDHLELEGHFLAILPQIMGDMRYNSMVWIPAIKTLYASDVLFNQAHPFTCEVTAEERLQWIAEIDKIERMGAEVIIPGHQRPGMRFDGSSLDFTRDYLVATDEVLAQTESVADFYYAMAERFPYATLLHLSNEMNAAVFKGGRDWHWRDEE